MPIQGGETFFGLCRTFRHVWIGGRFGGGKTALASYLSWVFLHRGWVETVVSNYPLAIGTFPPPSPLQHAAIVMDETAEFMGSWPQAQKYIRNLRKYDLIFFMPSVHPPHARLTRFNVKRVFNFYVLGLPIWMYKYELKSDNHHGYFFWLNPIGDIKGLYSTEYNPTSDWGVQAAVVANMTAQKAVAQAQADGIADETGDLSGDETDSVTIEGLETLSDVAGQFEDVGNKLQRILKR